MNSICFRYYIENMKKKASTLGALSNYIQNIENIKIIYLRYNILCFKSKKIKMKSSNRI